MKITIRQIIGIIITLIVLPIVYYQNSRWSFALLPIVYTTIPPMIKSSFLNWFFDISILGLFLIGQIVSIFDIGLSLYVIVPYAIFVALWGIISFVSKFSQDVKISNLIKKSNKADSQQYLNTDDRPYDSR